MKMLELISQDSLVIRKIKILRRTPNLRRVRREQVHKIVDGGRFKGLCLVRQHKINKTASMTINYSEGLLRVVAGLFSW